MRKIALLGLIAFLVNGCGSSSSSSSNTSDEIVGYLIDSAVQGVEYRCGDKVDITGEEGKFICSMLPVTFYIGSIEIGSVSKLNSDHNVFPQDMIGVDRNETTNEEVVKIATMLQSLDSDGNASNGITITSQTRQELTGEEPIVLRETSLTVLSERYPTIHLVEEEPAIEHLNLTVDTVRQQESAISSDEQTPNTNSETTSQEGVTNENNPSSGDTQENSDTNETNTTTSASGETVTLPNGYSYAVVNNSGTVVEGTVAEYRIVLYANYEERANAQSPHQGIVVELNGEYSTLLSVQATYIGHTVIAALYDAEGTLVKVSEAIEISKDTSIVSIPMSI